MNFILNRYEYLTGSSPRNIRPRATFVPPLRYSIVETCFSLLLLLVSFCGFVLIRGKSRWFRKEDGSISR